MRTHNLNSALLAACLLLAACAENPKTGRMEFMPAQPANQPLMVKDASVECAADAFTFRDPATGQMVTTQLPRRTVFYEHHIMPTYVDAPKVRAKWQYFPDGTHRVVQMAQIQYGKDYQDHAQYWRDLAHEEKHVCEGAWHGL